MFTTMVVRASSAGWPQPAVTDFSLVVLALCILLVVTTGSAGQQLQVWAKCCAPHVCMCSCCLSRPVCTTRPFAVC